MPLRIVYHNTETHADEADGWDELIGKGRCHWVDVIGDFVILRSEELMGGMYYIVNDEQGHILEIWTNEHQKVRRATVYNPIFTMDG